MKSAGARFFCWFLAIISMIAAIIILLGPIGTASATLLDYLKITWCPVALFSPYVLMFFFAILRREKFWNHFLHILIPLAALGLAILLSYFSALPNSEAELCGILYFVTALANVMTSFAVFAEIINEDDGSSRSGGSSREDNCINDATGDEGYVDTTGLWP